MIADEGIGEAEEIAGLHRVGLVAQEGRKRLDGIRVVSALVFDQADIEANTRHFGVEPLRFVKLAEGLLPIFAAHGDDAEIGASGGRARIEIQDLVEGGLRGAKVTIRECLLSPLKDRGGVGGSIRRLRRFCRGSGRNQEQERAQYKTERRAQPGVRGQESSLCFQIDRNGFLTRQKPANDRKRRRERFRGISWWNSLQMGLDISTKVQY